MESMPDGQAGKNTIKSSGLRKFLYPVLTFLALVNAGLSIVYVRPAAYSVAPLRDALTIYFAFFFLLYVLYGVKWMVKDDEEYVRHLRSRRFQVFLFKPFLLLRDILYDRRRTTHKDLVASTIILGLFELSPVIILLNFTFIIGIPKVLSYCFIGTLSAFVFVAGMDALVRLWNFADR